MMLSRLYVIIVVLITFVGVISVVPCNYVGCPYHSPANFVGNIWYCKGGVDGNDHERICANAHSAYKVDSACGDGNTPGWRAYKKRNNGGAHVARNVAACANFAYALPVNSVETWRSCNTAFQAWRVVMQSATCGRPQAISCETLRTNFQVCDRNGAGALAAGSHAHEIADARAYWVQIDADINTGSGVCDALAGPVNAAAYRAIPVPNPWGRLLIENDQKLVADNNNNKMMALKTRIKRTRTRTRAGQRQQQLQQQQQQ